jgi:predicted PurR-regulated permease PerM
MTLSQTPSSPTWGTNTKLVVALTIVVIVGALLVKFQFVISPLLIAFMMSYLFHPVASFLQRRMQFSWGAAVGVVYFLILIFFLGVLTAGGVGLVQQIQSLVTIVQNVVANLPQLIEELSSKVYQFGPFKLDFRVLDLNAISSQIIGIV